MLKIGQIVTAVAGRDKGKFYAVVGMCEKGVMIADGKRRMLTKPKAKNMLHVKKTNAELTPEAFATDKKLRKALAAYRGETIVEGGS